MKDKSKGKGKGKGKVKQNKRYWKQRCLDVEIVAVKYSEQLA